MPEDGKITFPETLRLNEITILMGEPKETSDGSTPTHFIVKLKIHACANYTGMLTIVFKRKFSQWNVLFEF